MLSLGHGMKGLEEVTISGDVICHAGLKDPIVGRLLLGGHIDRDHCVLFYDGEEK
jgi:hypothetical protein